MVLVLSQGLFGRLAAMPTVGDKTLDTAGQLNRHWAALRITIRGIAAYRALRAAHNCVLLERECKCMQRDDLIVQLGSVPVYQPLADLRGEHMRAELNRRGQGRASG